MAASNVHQEEAKAEGSRAGLAAASVVAPASPLVATPYRCGSNGTYSSPVEGSEAKGGDSLGELNSKDSTENVTREPIGTNPTEADAIVDEPPADNATPLPSPVHAATTEINEPNVMTPTPPPAQTTTSISINRLSIANLLNPILPTPLRRKELFILDDAPKAGSSTLNDRKHNVDIPQPGHNKFTLPSTAFGFTEKTGVTSSRPSKNAEKLANVAEHPDYLVALLLVEMRLPLVLEHNSLKNDAAAKSKKQGVSPAIARPSRAKKALPAAERREPTRRSARIRGRKSTNDVKDEAEGANSAKINKENFDAVEAAKAYSAPFAIVTANVSRVPLSARSLPQEKVDGDETEEDESVLPLREAEARKKSEEKETTLARITIKKPAARSKAKAKASAPDSQAEAPKAVARASKAEGKAPKATKRARSEQEGAGPSGGPKPKRARK